MDFGEEDEEEEVSRIKMENLKYTRRENVFYFSFFFRHGNINETGFFIVCPNV